MPNKSKIVRKKLIHISKVGKWEFLIFIFWWSLRYDFIDVSKFLLGNFMNRFIEFIKLLWSFQLGKQILLSYIVINNSFVCHDRLFIWIFFSCFVLGKFIPYGNPPRNVVFVWLHDTQQISLKYCVTLCVSKVSWCLSFILYL